MTQSPTHAGYGGRTVQATPDTSLPFTGLDIPLLFIAGVVLAATGRVLRNLGKKGA